MWVFVVFIVLVILCTILFYSFEVKLLAYAGLLNETVALSVRIGRLAVYSAKLHFVENDLYLTGKRGTPRKINITEKIDFSLAAHILRALENKRTQVGIFAGVANDEYNSSMLCGSFASIAAAASPIMQKSETQVKTSITKMENDELTFTVSFDAQTSIARLLWMLITKKVGK